MKTQQHARATALMLLAGVAFALHSTPATAGPNDGSLMHSGYLVVMPGTGTNWYGAYHVADRTAFCTDLASGPPSKGSGWVTAPATELRKQTGWGGGRLPHGNSAEIASERELAEISWVLQTVGHSPVPDLSAATEHFVRLRTISGPEQVERESERWEAVIAAHPEAETRFLALEDEAPRLAGPYSLHLTWGQEPTFSGREGELRVQVLSAVGAPIEGLDVKLEHEGALEMVIAPTATDQEGVSVSRWALEGWEHLSATATIRASVRGLAANRPLLLTPAEESVQRLVSTAPRVNINGSIGLAVAPLPIRGDVVTHLTFVGQGDASSATTWVEDQLTIENLSPGLATDGAPEGLEVLASGALLGPIPPVSTPEGPSCTDLDWAAAPVLNQYANWPVGKGDSAGLLRTELVEPGCYTASAEIKVQVGTAVIATLPHPPGMPLQTLLIQTTPTPEPTPAEPTPTEPHEESSIPAEPKKPSASPSPPVPDTPRINSGTPLGGIDWPIMLGGVVMLAIAVGPIATRLSRPAAR